MNPAARRRSRTSMGNSMRDNLRGLGYKDEELCPPPLAQAHRLSNANIFVPNGPPPSVPSSAKVPSSIPRISHKPAPKSKIPVQSGGFAGCTTPGTQQLQTPSVHPKTTGRMEVRTGPRSSLFPHPSQARITPSVGAGASSMRASSSRVSRTVAKPAQVQPMSQRGRSQSASRTGRIDNRLSQNKSVLSRAISAESLCFTPMATPKSSFSSSHRSNGKASFALKSPGGGQESIRTQPTCKPPDSTNKKALFTIALMVNEFLQEREYPKKFTIEEFNRITVTEYFNICKFILQLMQYPIPVSATKPDELINVISEAQKFYGCGITLSKSTLKTPTSPHSWPAALTFLAWLSNRADACLTDRFASSKLKNIHCLSDNLDLHIDRQLSDTYVRLFHTYYEGVYNIEEEEEKFRQDLVEVCEIDTNVTIESLETLKATKLAELAEIQAKEDPAKQIEENLKKTEEGIHAAKKCNAELSDLVAKLSKLENIDSNIIIVEKKILHETQRLKEITDTVENQPITVDQKAELLKEIGDLHKEQTARNHVINDMSTNLERAKQVLENVKAGFYTACERLKISEEYNSKLDKLERLKLLNAIKRIERNPFDAGSLGSYLEEQNKSLSVASNILLQLKHNLCTRLRNEDSRIKSVETDAEDIEREYMETEKKVNGIQDQVQDAKLHNQYKALKIQLKEIKDKLELLDARLAKSKKHLANSLCKGEQKRKTLDELKDKKKVLSEDVLNQWLDLEEMEAREEVLAIAATVRAAKIYEAAYEKLYASKKK